MRGSVASFQTSPNNKNATENKPLNNYTNFAIWWRMMRYMKRYRGWAILAFVGIIGTNLLAIAIPSILGEVIDVGVARGERAYMLAAGLLVVGLGILRGFMGFLSRYFGEKLSHYIAYDIRNDNYNKVQTLAFSYHDNAQVGTLVTRAIADVSEIQRYFGFGLIDGLNTALLFVGVAIIMFIESPLLAIVTLLPMFPLVWLSWKFVLEIDPRWRQIMDRTQTLSNHLQENAIGAQVVRVFARENYELDKFKAQNAMLYGEQMEFIRAWGTFLPVSAFIAALCTALVLLFGGLMEQQDIGNVTVGLVVSFNAYVLLMAQPMRFVGFVLLLTTQAVASARRVFEILDAPETIVSKSNPVVKEPLEGVVRFEKVSFRYDDAIEESLYDINLEARPGQVTALIGATGSGKTSVISLIPRFYDTTQGEVTIDGIDVRNYEIHRLRRQIGLVLQDSLLFSATIHENIAYGRPDATREQAIEAAKAANAHDFIMEFPEGYETWVGERGVTLSGGQRQRVAIARALLIDPRILILDDAMSSVDTQTEFLIQEALERLMAGRTVFIIAQRLSSVLNADQIIVLDHGRVAERGTHEDLLKLGTLYAEIYRLQLAEQEKLRLSLEEITKRRSTNEETQRTTNEVKTLVEKLSGD